MVRSSPPDRRVAGDCAMTTLTDLKTRTELLHRLKRAEGQLRGVQRMIEDGDDCLAIASQMSAVRKALDSAYVRMTVCFIEQELGERLGDKDGAATDLTHMMAHMEAMLGKIR